MDCFGTASLLGRRFVCRTEASLFQATRDGGEKLFSKKNAKNALGLGRRQGPSFPSGSRRFARFNTSPLYYLRAWHRLHGGERKTRLTGDEAQETIR